jgi:4-hydroxy-4-methyl-2-oxoglutarate aldolase
MRGASIRASTVGLMQPYMRPIYAGAHACGTAVTVLLQPGDNWMMHVAAEQIQPGDVVVAACTSRQYRRLLRRPAGHQFRARGARAWSSTAACAT